MSKKIFYIFLFFVTNIVIAIGFLHRIIKDIFGVVTLEQIVFNFQGAGGNIDSSFYPLIFLWSGLFLIVFLCHCGIFVNYVWKRKVFDRSIAYKILRIVELKIVDIINHSPRYTYIFISVVICACIGSFIERKYDVLSFIHRPDSNFIENNYVIPKIEFTEKRNLVLVFLESMERGYTNENIFGKNLIPDLQRLAQANTTFIGHEESIGSEWTQAAHVNMLMGIPLLLSKNGKSKVQEFLQELFPLRMFCVRMDINYILSLALRVSSLRWRNSSVPMVSSTSGSVTTSTRKDVISQKIGEQIGDIKIRLSLKRC